MTTIVTSHKSALPSALPTLPPSRDTASITSCITNLPYCIVKIEYECERTIRKVKEVTSRIFFFLAPMKMLYAPLRPVTQKISHVWTRFCYFLQPFFSKPYTIHDELIMIASSLGYKSKTGICHGIAYMGIQAALIGDIDSFNTRINKLDALVKKHHGVIHYVIEEMKKDPVFFHECLAFFDGVKLWQDPDEYNDVLEQPNALSQASRQHLQTVSPIVASQQLKALKGFHLANRFSGIYNESELLSYLQELKTVFNKSSKTDPIAVQLANLGHAISIVYNPRKNCWLFIDADRLPVTEETDETLAKKLHSFDFSSPPREVISSSIYTLKKNNAAVKKNLATWFKSEKYNSLHRTLLRKEPLTELDKYRLLIIAARNDHLDDTSFLLSTDTDFSREVNLPPIYMAAQNGHAKIVKILVDHGANVEDSFTDQTPLLAAANMGHADVINILINKGAKIRGNELKAILGRTPFECAIAKKRLKAVKALLNHGANPNGGYWQTPLQLAAASKSSEIVTELLRRGANPNLRYIGPPPLYAAAEAGDLKTVNALLEFGANPQPRDYLGETPLRIATQKGYLDIVNVLKASDAKK